MYIVEKIGDNGSVRLNGFSEESIKSVLQTGKKRWSYEYTEVRNYHTIQIKEQK